MKELAERISNSELEVMRILWEAGEALPVTEIRKRLQQRSSWEDTTIKTLVQRLTVKGVLLQEKKKVFYYTPLISKEEYSSWVTGNLIEKLYEGSAGKLVAALAEKRGLSPQDMEELRALLCPDK